MTENSQLSSQVAIKGNSRALIWTGNSHSFLMDHFTMENGTDVQFMSGSSDPFTLNIGSKVTIESDSHLDFSRLWECKLNATYRYNEVSVGRITYGRILVFNYGNIIVNGKIGLYPGVSQSVWHTSYLWFKETDSIHLTPQAHLVASYIQLHS